MASVPEPVAAFLRGKRIAVAGVSRDGQHAANSVFRKLKNSGYEVFPINPSASVVEDVRCYPNVGAIPEGVDGVVVATPPDAAVEVVRQCSEHGVRRVWFHRSFGSGSVSEEAIRECHALGVDCIVGGCPLMFCEPVDIAHKCMRWWLQLRGRVPR